MVNDFRELTRRVIRRKEELELKDNALADRAGISRDMLRKWLATVDEEKVRVPSYINVLAVLNALDINTSVNKDVLAEAMKHTEIIAESERLSKEAKVEVFSVVYEALCNRIKDGAGLYLDRYSYEGILKEAGLKDG